MELELKPVLDPKTGEIQLYDMYIDGEWHGSRRTEEQCREYYDQLLNGPIQERDPALKGGWIKGKVEDES